MTTALSFTKMHGLGNDFILLDNPVDGSGDTARQLTPERDKAYLERLAAFLCDRHFGIGADGLILPASPRDKAQADIRFVYLNSDGSWAEMCGNGIRCFARFVRDRKWVDKDAFTVDTAAGLIRPRINADNTVTVDMGAPILAAAAVPFEHASHLSTETAVNVPVSVNAHSIPVTAVSMGNPHCLIFQDDLPEWLDPAVMGPLLETHASFPAKTNVEFIDIIDPHHVNVVVWERGCGFTLACGTGACATAVAGILQNKVKSPVQVDLPGGPLQIEWDGNATSSVMMSGPAAYVFSGSVELPADLRLPEPVVG